MKKESFIYKYIRSIMGFSLIFICPNPLTAAELSQAVPLETEKSAYAEPWQRYTQWKQTDWKDFNTLSNAKASPPVAKTQTVETPVQGNPDQGKELVADRKRGGSCLACHVLPEETLPGNVGPDLSTIGTWKRTDEYLFNYIYDPRQFNPKTAMPPWGIHQIFSREEIKDLVAYLKTLKSPTQFPNEVDDPAKRPLPVEDRDNLDPFENPAMASIDVAKDLFVKIGTKEQSCQSCHEKPEKVFKTWAVTMPKFSPRLKKVIGIEEFVTRHARATTQADYPLQSQENLALSTYLRFLANGQAIAVQADDEKTQAAIKHGEALTQQKIGQLNFACVDCHATHANQWIRGQRLASFKGMLDHFPTYRTSRDEIWDIQKRFQWCGVAIRANELPPGSPEYGDLEMYLTFSNNGQLLSVPGIRH